MEVTSERVAAASRLFFGITDYVIFSAMLLGCVGIGVYFGFFKVAVNAEQYLLGGRRMAIFPVAVSLVASFISGITLLGTPTELYLRGTQYVFMNVSIFTAPLFIGFAYLPVFHGLKITSTYEYLEMRFGKSARLLGSFLFIVGIITWIPIVIYMPALAFNQVTGINVHIVTPIVCAVCIFYTCVGGLKAVVWTDVIQTVLMFVAVILVIVKGTFDVGGLGTVWQRNMDSGRIELPDLGFDLTARHSWFGFLVGGFFGWLPLGVSQMALQRFASIESLPKARLTMWMFLAGALCLTLMSCYTGLLTYAVYHDCDPLTTKQATAKDQLLPLLVMETLQNLPGMPGIFVAGVFSAALSSMSTALNSISAVVLEDFFKTFYGQDALSERQTDILLKSVVVIFGVLCTSLVFVVEKLGTVLQLSMSLSSMTNGPVLGVFSAGMFLPWVNTWGAIFGGLTGLIFMGWVVLGSQAVMAAGLITIPSKPVTIAGCSADLLRHLNTTAISAAANSTITTDAASSVLPIYRVSYLWYTTMGLAVTLVAAVVISLVTGKRDLATVDRSLVTPLMRWVLPEGRRASATRVDRVRSSISTYEGYKAVKMQMIFTDEEKTKEEL
ncbi:sodium-coupled monocarboxylate transporter 1-like isoform X3 [Schistocerca gregaria]|uniref:sodium-coupled monocarboxylate transporter 1-like isoform X3 n=1 Tax=Schistocerca gregaria TaxID=7010 RepID=UPI00211E01E7|nr:sodium-coupled monocarboxylate transporter 1-like isoform X3 [Schistocerca gregaria]